MLFALARLFFRIVLLVWGVWSVFYFYVFGYRYKIHGFFRYKTAGIYKLYVFSNKKNILLNSQKLFLVDHKVTLYSLYDGECAKLEIWDYEDFLCFDRKKLNTFVYISPKVVKIYPFHKRYFVKLKLELEWDMIKFRFKDVNFLYNGKQLFYVDDINTKHLIDLPNVKFVGYTKNSLVFIKSGKIYALSFND